ncbi:TIR domain-containing protein [Arthrobacter glacialis]|uniref:TIR domain-containing protein n=1 Tax=Arthrobacter glacialis TaxID=1664 RepID=UPI000CD3DE33|nr:TIR domain-containing protein [Arthrobacter glacialis]POH57108.1 hypothetical protein CVS28_17045 [Arthrobacter glacialis]
MNKSPQEYEFDVAVSFAGEDRDYVADIVEAIRKDGIRVFYDEDYEVEAWGEDGIEYFSNVYENRARYAVMFVSEHYARKMWTRTERRAALARAATQRSAYVLPIRLDDTQLDGLLHTTIYLDARRLGIDRLIPAIKKKVGEFVPTQPASILVDGKVPRSQEAIEATMTERTGIWEHLLYAGLLNVNMGKLEPKYQDFSMGYARRTGHYVPRDGLVGHVQQAIGAIQRIVDNFNLVLDPEVQERAFGKPGEPGDVDRIVHMAERFISVYEDFMDWAAELRGTSASGDGAEVFKMLARWAEQPVDECRRFVREFVTEMDIATERLARGERINLNMTLTLKMDSAISNEMNAKLRQALNEE